MKNFSAVLSFLLIIAGIYWSFYSLMPQHISKASTPQNQFSTERALTHVRELSKEPHYVGSENHEQAIKYLVAELQKLNLQVTIQEGYTSGDWGNLSKAKNIIAKIKGTGNGKSLVLMSHYDSSPHSSYGASDAGSGVATILEGIRAYLAEGKKPLNDIIILFTDGEELGLNGAQLFVNKNTLAENVGLVLNFEARGSGGPSYMLMETNGSNAKLIEHFKKAHPEYPVATSLAYSIYKKLPNDTDLTVFREDRNIDGYNFAFIGDHYDYHTANDSYSRLDRNTLEHQGSYLMPLLRYFSQTSIDNLKSEEDLVYFNFPWVGVISYSFNLIIPMLIGSILIFLFLIAWGIKKQRLNAKEIGKGSIAFIMALVLSGIIGFYGWNILKALYPQYQDILQGFTYNGYTYIAFFALLSIAICFFAYSLFKDTKPVNLIIAPLLLWLMACLYVSVNLKGAGFFIVPVIFGLLSLFVLIKQERPNAFLLVLLCLPTIFILAPFAQMFPVALGLKMIVSATILTTLIFGLLISVTGFYGKRKTLGILSLILAIIYFGKAHFNSRFDENQPRPTSLVYVLDTDLQEAGWGTYNHVLDEWTSKYITKEEASGIKIDTFPSKYANGFTYTSKAKVRNIPVPDIAIKKDTVMGSERHLTICITPHRNINRMDLFSKSRITALTANGSNLSQTYLKSRGTRLLTHYVSENASTELDITINTNENLELTVYESSFDLLENLNFDVPQRAADAIPMPFVLNDAIITKKTIKIE